MLGSFYFAGLHFQLPCSTRDPASSIFKLGFVGPFFVIQLASLITKKNLDTASLTHGVKMTRSCTHTTRGYCFCEFCIAAFLKIAYEKANNSPSEKINFKKFKRSIQLSPLEICREFSNTALPNDELPQRAYTSAPLNSPNLKNIPTVKLEPDDNQIKFLRLLSDRLTKEAHQQTKYVINSKTVDLTNPNNSALLQRRLKLNPKLNTPLITQPSRIRSSMSESSGYETPRPTESPLPISNTTHCSSAGMLFNSSGLSVDTKSRIKFGPEDILETTNPMLLFSSNLSDESTVCFSKRASRRRRKSSSKKEAENRSNECSDSDSMEKDTKSSKALSNVTNTLDKKVASSSKLFAPSLSLLLLFGLAGPSQAFD